MSTRCASTARAHRYSLRVSGGPRQLGVFEDENGSRDVIRRALHLIRRQREEIRPAVLEAKRLIRAVRVILLRARAHHAAEDAGDRRSHACHHDGVCVCVCVHTPVRPELRGNAHYTTAL